MAGLRSVLLTILLAVLVGEFFLPFYCHHWHDAHPWRTPAVLQFDPGPQSVAGHDDWSEMTGGHPVLVAGFDLLGDLLVAFGLYVLLVLGHVWMDPYAPTRWTLRAAGQRHTGVDLPPPDTPPQILPLSFRFI